MRLNRVVIASPTKNITAIVFDAVARNQKVMVAARIQSSFPSVEQVLFVEAINGQIHAEMAGGELCLNGARALGWVLSNGQKRHQRFTMSGHNGWIDVDSTPQKAALSISSAYTVDQVLFEGQAVSVVHFKSISHVVLPAGHPAYAELKQQAARPDRFDVVMKTLKHFGVTQREACCLMFAEKNEARLVIEPYVYIKKTGTLVPEMSCGSGSVATAILAYQQEQTSQGRPYIEIAQPCGESLFVSLYFKSGLVHCSVEGSMSVLWDGAVEDLDEVGSQIPDAQDIRPQSHACEYETVDWPFLGERVYE